MTVAWPTYADILAPGFGLGADGDVERTTFDDGMIRQEKRRTGALRTADITALIARADLVRFRTWAETEAHAWFDFPSPLIDGAARTVRVRVRGGAGGIGYRAEIAPDGTLRWAARMTVEGPNL